MYKFAFSILVLTLALACSSPPAVEWEEKQIDNESLGTILKSVEHGPVAAHCANLLKEPQLTVRLSKPVAPSATPSGEPELRVIDVSTTVNGKNIVVEWTTWSSANKLLNVRKKDASTLTQAIFSANVDSFHLEFHKFPELSQDFPVPDLERALEDADMECFKQ